MNGERLAAALGVVATIAVLALTATPYAVAGSMSVGTYYGVGLASPLFVSLLSVVVAITLVAAAKRRSDPALAAGIAVTVAAFAVGIGLLWAVPAREVAMGIDSTAAPVLGVGAQTLLEYHAHAVVIATLVLVVAAVGYAREVL